MSFETWLLFCVTEAVLCVTPGPAVMLVVSMALTRGPSAGVGASLGFPLGWMVIAVPGIVVAIALLAIELPPGPPPSESLSRSTTKLRRDAVIVLRIPTVRRLMAATTVMAFAAGGMQAWLLDFLEKEKSIQPITGSIRSWTGRRSR